LLHVLLLEQFSSTQRKIANLFSTSALEAAVAQYHPPSATGPYELPHDKQEELLRSLDRTGISRGVLYELSLGSSWNQLCRNYSIHSERSQQLDICVPWFAPYRRMIAMDKTGNTDLLRTQRLSDYKKIAQKCAAKGRIGWQDLYRNHRKAYGLLFKHDRRFLENLRGKIYSVVVRRRARGPASLEACKARVLLAISSLSLPTRSEIWRAEKHAMLVLSRHCPDWLQSNLPPAFSSAAEVQRYKRHHAASKQKTSKK
jgi:hypothetical protein